MKNLKNKMPLFIAEVSSNHSQNLERSLEFIDKSAEIGCGAVKFQLFKVEELFSKEAFANKPHLINRKAWELPLDFLPTLAKRCAEKNILFSCTPFYIEAVKELAPYVAFYKVASYELLWDDLLIACAKTGKPVIISTGMATMPEINHAVEVLKTNDCKDIIVLHCTSAYPTPHNEANLAALNVIREATQCKIGWSDHTVEPGVIYRSVYRWGAEVVEFHLDLDGKGEEFEAGHCWLPEQMKLVIDTIRTGLESDGNGVKEPVASELPDRQWRADPTDGLRPLKSLRVTLERAK